MRYGFASGVSRPLWSWLACTNRATLSTIVDFVYIVYFVPSKTLWKIMCVQRLETRLESELLWLRTKVLHIRFFVFSTTRFWERKVREKNVANKDNKHCKRKRNNEMKDWKGGKKSAKPRGSARSSKNRSRHVTTEWRHRGRPSLAPRLGGRPTWKTAAEVEAKTLHLAAIIAEGERTRQTFPRIPFHYSLLTKFLIYVVKTVVNKIWLDFGLI